MIMGTLAVPVHVDGMPVGSLQDDLAYFMRRRGFDNANELAHAAGLSWPTVDDILTGKRMRRREVQQQAFINRLALRIQKSRKLSIAWLR